MAAFTTELFMFESSDEFNNNPDLITPALKLVLAENGAHPTAFYGKQVENPGMGYVFLNWDSYESHQAVINSPSYGPIAAALKPSELIGGKASIYHVIFSAPTVALEKPVTEVFILSLKSPENRATVVEILSKFEEASEKMLVFGQTREDENKYIVIGGWPSVEAHWERSAQPDVKKGLDALYALADKEQLFHTKLSQYTV